MFNSVCNEQVALDQEESPTPRAQLLQTTRLSTPVESGRALERGKV